MKNFGSGDPAAAQSKCLRNGNGTPNALLKFDRNVDAAIGGSIRKDSIVKNMSFLTGLLAVLVLSAGSGAAWSQSSGASPADPNNERNQVPAPSNSQPADPAAGSDPGARVPTAPVDRREAQGEEGGATGTRPGGAMPAPVAPAAVPPGE